MNYSSLFLECVDRVLAIEKYMSKDQRDLGNKGGNITIWGISSRYHPKVKSWLNLPRKDSKKLAIDIYFKKYWRPTAGKILPFVGKHTSYIVFDTAVQFAPRDANKMLQRAINRIFGEKKLKVDGIIGKKTLEMLENIGTKNWRYELCWIYKSLRLYKHLQTISKNHGQAVHAGGWGKRTMGL